MRRSYKIAGILSVVIILLDQFTKVWIQETLPLYGNIEVIPGCFNIVHVLNKGSAFGFLNRPDLPWVVYFFFCTTALAILLILHLLKTVSDEDTPLIFGLGCILGGAIGNLIDRIRLGEVVDFLDFYYKQYHWPAFNVADIAITIGSMTLFFAFIFIRKVEPK